VTEPLKVLIWGTAEEGPCAYYRGYQYDEPLRELGIEMRHMSKVDFKVSKGWEDKPVEEAFKAHAIEVDVAPIEWADVLVFRRYYNSTLKCGESTGPENPGCGFATHDLEAAARHEHGFRRQDDITRVIWDVVRDGWTGGVVYETDDNHWAIKPWNGYYPDVIAERDLIADMTRRADLVTVATPALAETYGKYNRNVRVVRNAIDPDLYIKDTPRPEGDKPRLVYYGSTARLRDYGGRHITQRKEDGAGYALRAVQDNQHLLQRVFLGTNEGTEEVIGRLFDEQTPYIVGIAQFSKALANSHGDIGIAPLGGDEFDRCKSELHWLEYAVCDMAVVAERFSGSGPYSVIRHGVDGLLARGAQEWHDSIRKLAKSPDLRADLAGRAKERVLAEYDYRVRAHEWADAFRWAWEHRRGDAQGNRD
jgi:glycosyltransferase involved in cell wall biosynthesis